LVGGSAWGKDTIPLIVRAVYARKTAFCVRPNLSLHLILYLIIFHGLSLGTFARQ